jgi:hypothetical protein
MSLGWLPEIGWRGGGKQRLKLVVFAHGGTGHPVDGCRRLKVWGFDIDVDDCFLIRRLQVIPVLQPGKLRITDRLLMFAHLLLFFICQSPICYISP